MDLICEYCLSYKRGCKSYLASLHLAFETTFFPDFIYQRIGASQTLQAKRVGICTPVLHHIGKGLYLGEEALRNDLVVADCRDKTVSAV